MAEEARNDSSQSGDRVARSESADTALDRFERVRDSLWGQPGFQRRNSTIIAKGFSLLPTATWIVETLRTDENVAIFLQVIDKDGGQRLVLPEKVCQAIYNQYHSIMASRKKLRAKKAAETRKAKKGNIPFQREEKAE